MKDKCVMDKRSSQDGTLRPVSTFSKQHTLCDFEVRANPYFDSRTFAHSNNSKDEKCDECNTKLVKKIPQSDLPRFTQVQDAKVQGVLFNLPQKSTILTNFQALCALYSIHNFARANSGKKDGFDYPYGEGFFSNHIQFTGLFRVSRGVTLRLAKSPCIICKTPLSSVSIGDHIIPKSKGGRDGLSNYLPLCKKHNSSKGDKDLIEWMVVKETVRDIPLDALCAYTRESFSILGDRQELDLDAPEYILEAIKILAHKYLLGGSNGVHWRALLCSLIN